MPSFSATARSSSKAEVIIFPGGIWKSKRKGRKNAKRKSGFFSLRLSLFANFAQKLLLIRCARPPCFVEEAREPLHPNLGLLAEPIVMILIFDRKSTDLVIPNSHLSLATLFAIASVESVAVTA